MLSVATLSSMIGPRGSAPVLGTVRLGRGDEAVVVVRRHELDDRRLIAIGIDSGYVREVDLEDGRDVEHARALRRGKRPHGRAFLVGAEQAAERRRDAADGGIHERERLAREALQTFHALAATAAAARERHLRDRRRDRSAIRRLNQPYTR